MSRYFFQNDRILSIRKMTGVPRSIALPFKDKEIRQNKKHYETPYFLLNFISTKIYNGGANHLKLNTRC